MNLLAHAYLSFRDPSTLVGNMISDYVKGRQKFTFSEPVQKGMELHRLIDHYTDVHPATHAAKQVFRPVYRLYSGAFVDVAYDHFLANDEREFPGDELASFSKWVYDTLDRHTGAMPVNFERMLPHMRLHDWLYNYRTLDGIGKSFGGLVRRAAYLYEAESAITLFQEHYQLLQDCYRHFWADALPYVRDQFMILQRK